MTKRHAELVIKATGSFLIITLLMGCATALKRESHCLASLTPEYLSAQQELAHLKASLRKAQARRDRAFLIHDQPSAELMTRRDLQRSESEILGTEPASDRLEQVQQEARTAFDHLVKTKARYRPTMMRYQQVSKRVQVRMQEEHVLSQVRTLLVAGSGWFLYPFVSWAVHSAFWNGVDPDAESDPIAQYCAARPRIESGTN
ncbi:MAG: hypothetical protein ACE5NA_09410 [Nitrospiraceae bacterium]